MRRIVPLVLLLACGDDPNVAQRAASEPAPIEEPVVETPHVEVPAEDPLDLDALPEVVEWKEDAERCDAHRGRRFCNGPRRVPVWQGQAAQRARELGLGTHRAAAELIRTAPRPEWLAAVTSLNLEERRKLVWPIDGARYGRGVEFRGRRITHRGVDFTAEVGTPIRAVSDALVGYADNTIRGYGNLLVLLHASGEVSAYAHLSAVHVFPGQVVRAGQHVALSGNTGISRGPHLHMEWREDGEIADPMPRFPSSRLPRWMRSRLSASR